MRKRRKSAYTVWWPKTETCKLERFEGETRIIDGKECCAVRCQSLSGAERAVKRVFDIVFCTAALAVLSPLFLVCAVLIKCTSKGPVFYSQERIGKNGKPFQIYKFRSMYTDAEQNGPCLSKIGDPRITSCGEFMRKYRIDELPQLWNVVKGDMSLVGYRPERKFYIDQIVKISPYYTLLLNEKPGITSRGITVKGYAENVEQMTVRLEEDMKYLENLSLAEDLRIIWLTVKVVLYGRGK